MFKVATEESNGVAPDCSHCGFHRHLLPAHLGSEMDLSWGRVVSLCNVPPSVPFGQTTYNLVVAGSRCVAVPGWSGWLSENHQWIPARRQEDAMSRTLAYIHTVPSLVPLFDELSKELLPEEAEVFHIADEVLLKVVISQGGLSPFIYRRVAEHVAAAEVAGASVVQLTCSSISPCVEVVRWLASVPVLKVDEPMVDEAIAMGRRIGIVATAATTLGPTADLVRTRATVAGKDVQIESVLCHGAYEALLAGEMGTHDRIVRDCLQGLLLRSDVVILAQASMARVVAGISAHEQKVPILTSPRSAVLRAARVLAGEAV